MGSYKIANLFSFFAILQRFRAILSNFKKVFAQTFLKSTPYKSTTYDTLFRMSLKRKNPYKSTTYASRGSKRLDPGQRGGAETLIL
jgi:hypothetical protein